MEPPGIYFTPFGASPTGLEIKTQIQTQQVQPSPEVASKLIFAHNLLESGWPRSKMFWHHSKLPSTRNSFETTPKGPKGAHGPRRGPWGPKGPLPKGPGPWAAALRAAGQTKHGATSWRCDSTALRLSSTLRARRLCRHAGENDFQGLIFLRFSEMFES